MLVRKSVFWLQTPAGMVKYRFWKVIAWFAKSE